jgi:glycerophosphoryl diester phosphodiesterase
VIAHRGASAAALENTLTAFRLAREQGADGVELDVLRCASGEVVVFHDDDLTRLAHRPGELRALDWDELQKVELDGGEHMPLLSQVLEELGPDLLVNVELKSPPTWRTRVRDDGLAASVAELLRRHAIEERALVSSFDPLLLARFRARSPTVATGLLFASDQSRPLREAWVAPFIAPTALHPEAALVDAIAMRGWRARGYAIHVWTVDAPAELRCLGALGVDAVITNRPSDAAVIVSR